jgi:hypothetical protein
VRASIPLALLVWWIPYILGSRLLGTPLAFKVVTLSRALKYLIGTGGRFLKPGKENFFIFQENARRSVCSGPPSAFSGKAAFAPGTYHLSFRGKTPKQALSGR